MARIICNNSRLFPSQLVHKWTLQEVIRDAHNILRVTGDIDLGMIAVSFFLTGGVEAVVIVGLVRIVKVIEVLVGMENIESTSAVQISIRWYSLLLGWL